MLLNSFITLPLFFSIHLSLFVVLFCTYCTLLDKDNPSHSRSIHLLYKQLFEHLKNNALLFSLTFFNKITIFVIQHSRIYFLSRLFMFSTVSWPAITSKFFKVSLYMKPLGLGYITMLHTLWIRIILPNYKMQLLKDYNSMCSCWCEME